MKNRITREEKIQVRGLTLIELMIVVVIVGVIAAVAIPSYISYIRRSYLSETSSAFAAIKNAEESYFSSNGCYVNALAWPAAIPRGTTTNWGTPGGAWVQSALNVRPDRLVHFQYEVYASNAFANGCGLAISKSSVGSGGAIDCLSDVKTLIPDSIFLTNWYVVVARGDLDGNGVNSTLITAIDDTSVISCNELY
jgi:prepilin-type N-terminal cleavage/methylation domain-containing protein